MGLVGSEMCIRDSTCLLALGMVIGYYSLNVMNADGAIPTKIYFNANHVSVPEVITYKSYVSFRQVVLDMDRTKPVVLHLHSFGGSLRFGYGMMNLMNGLEQFKIGKLDNYCYSMCAIMALQTDFVIAAPDSDILFHMPRYQEKQKDGTYKYHIIHVNDPETKDEAWKFIDNLVAKTPILEVLTKDEWKRFISGEDVILSGEEFMKRYNVVRGL